MRSLPCPHCYESPTNLDMHLRFDCPKLVGRRRYVAPNPCADMADPIYELLPNFFEDIEKFLDIQG